MEFLCKVCNGSSNDNEAEYKKHLAFLRRESDRILYKKYTNDNVSLDEDNKILNDYISFFIFILSIVNL